MAILWFIGAILGLSIAAYIADQFKNVAEEKGYYGGRYFWFPFLLGLIGCVYIAALPDRGKPTTERSEPVNNSGTSIQF